MDELNNPAVAALQSLCDKEGGFKVVADAIGVNNQSIYQILTFVKLPSGRPKGIGPSLRDKLDARYPGWNAKRVMSGGFPSEASEMAKRLAAAFDRIPNSDPIKKSRAFSAAFAAIEKELKSD
jgi:hypothetical protein